MVLAIFNPEHDLCMGKGRAHYVPPRSAVDFARRDAQSVMGVLYPDAVCCSVYSYTPQPPSRGDGEAKRPPLRGVGGCPFSSVIAWGWDAVVKHELIKRGIPSELLPSDEDICTIRELQHRSTILPLQPDCHEVHSIADMEILLRDSEHWVMKAPWSGAGRGLRWVHRSLTPIDRDWLNKTVTAQRCVIAEPRREVVADIAIEYNCPLTPFHSLSLPFTPNFVGYSYFKTGSGVYKENIKMTDERIVETFRETALQQTKEHVERWLETHVWPCYHGPLGVDLMVCADGSVHVAEINFRHTMGMVAHGRIKSEEQGGVL